MDSETEIMDSDNELVDKKFLPPEIEGYILSNPPNVNYINKISNCRSMGWNNLIVGSNALHSVVKAYAKVVNDISIILYTKTTRAPSN